MLKIIAEEMCWIEKIAGSYEPAKNISVLKTYLFSNNLRILSVGLITLPVEIS